MSNYIGDYQAGETIYVEFDSYDSSGASSAITGLAVTDIEIYKNGGTTQRASDSGYSLLDTDGIDFDGITGINGFSIDTSDNTTAGWWERGAHYRVVVSSITVDSQTVNFSRTFSIERNYHEDGGVRTTIATYTDNTNFTLTSGDVAAVDDVYNGWTVVVKALEVAERGKLFWGVVTDYTGSTQTVAVSVSQGTFTAAAGDIVYLYPPRTTDVYSMRANTVTNSAIAASAITPTEATVNVTQISGDTSAADNLEAAYDGTGYAGGTILQQVDIAAISGDTTSATNLESYTDGTTPMPVNMTQISGDGPAADNLEAAFDGTGYAGGTTKQQVEVVTMATDVITSAALSAAAVTEITDDIMADVVESQGSYTVQQALSIILSVLAGETSGGGTTFTTPDGVSTRVAATVDGSNNRTAMTLTPSS